MNDFLNQFISPSQASPASWLVLLPAAVMLLAAAAAVVLKNLVRAALCLTLSFIALGVVFLALGAEFVGLVQLLVYVGAVGMMIVFVILLTRPDLVSSAGSPFGGAGPAGGVLIALAFLTTLLCFIVSSPATGRPLPKAPAAGVERIGELLMGDYVLAMMAVGVLLTAALVGAAVIAMEDKKP